MFSRAEQSNIKTREKLLKIVDYCFQATNNTNSS